MRLIKGKKFKTKSNFIKNIEAELRAGNRKGKLLRWVYSEAEKSKRPLKRKDKS